MTIRQLPGALACGLLVLALEGAVLAEPAGNRGDASAMADAKVLLYLPFDGTTDARIAGGKAEATVSGPVTYGEGKKGEAMRASSGPLRYAVEGNMNRDRGTIMMWVKTPWDGSHTGYDRLFDSLYPETGAQCMLLGFHPRVKRWRFGIGAPASMECYSQRMAAWWKPNRWRHLAVAWDVQTGAAIYIDGKLSGRSGPAPPGTRVTPVEHLYVGASALNGSRGTAFLDEFYIYDRPLEAEQIALVHKRQAYKEKHIPATPAAENDKVAARKIEKEGVTHVVLENKYVKMVFAPELGGVCASLTTKDNGKQFTVLNDEPGWPGALFMDRTWSPQGLFGGLTYAYALNSTDDRASVHLWARGDKGAIFFLEVHKTITLYRDRNLIRVDYKVKNLPESFADTACGFQFHNFLGVKGEDNTYFTPTTEGVKSVDYKFVSGVVPKEANYWHYNPSRGWNAVAGSSGAGMACRMEYQYLDCFYNWLGLPVGTQEWMTRKQLIKAGDSFRTTFYMVPFNGLGRVDGVFDGLVCSLQTQDTYGAGDTIFGAAMVHCAAKRELELALRYRVLPWEEWREIARFPVSVGADQTVSRTFSFKPVAQGTVVLNCLVLDGGKEVGSFERPLTVGKPSGKYVMKPEGERFGESKIAARPISDGTRKRGRPLNTSFQTPHVKWAKPYSRGKTKVLVLTDVMHKREAVELWQRLSLEVNTVDYHWGMSDKNAGELLGNAGDGTVRTSSDQTQITLGYLEEKPDVVVISGLDWAAHFDPAVRKRILELVKQGMGLIHIAPMGLAGEWAEAVPLGSPGGRADGAWTKVKRHYLTDGFSFDVFPVCRNIVYKAQGDVLATVAGRSDVPLLAVGKLGKGRLVALGYDVYVHKLNSGLLPLRSVGERPAESAPLFDESDLTWNYWEYYYALLTKAIVWAARKESGLAITKFEAARAADQSVSLALALTSAADMSVTAVLDVRGKYSRSQQKIERELKVAAGKTTETIIPLQDDLLEGKQFVHLIVKDGEGKILNWAVAGFAVKHAVKIAKVAFVKNIETEAFEKGEAIAGEVLLSGAAGSRRLRARLYDYHGRLLEEKETHPSSVEANEIAFSLSSDAIVTNSARVDCELLDGGTATDIRREKFVVLGPRNFNKFAHGVWWHEYPREHLLPYFFSQARECGVENLMTGTLAHARLIRIAGNLNCHEWWHGIHYRFNRAEHREQMGRYAATRDKKHLVRKPCISDPQIDVDYIEERKNSWRQYARITRYDYIYSGDEWNMGEQYCFSEHCMKRMRAWLRAKYDEIGKLNREWESGFADWAQVLPDTLEQAKQKGNYASWGDHRLFMEENMTRHFTNYLKAARDVDPKTVFMLSALNGDYDWGHDWYALMQAGFKPMPYPSFNTYSVVEAARSFCRKGDRIGAYEHPWYALLHHADNLSFYTIHGFVKPELTIGRTEFHNFTNEVVRKGIYDLIRHAERAHDGIALHYSTSSRYAAHASAFTEHRFTKNLGAWQYLIEDLGLQYNYVARQQIESGELVQAGYKVLIMPCSMAVSDREAKQIRNFVSQGGLLVADVHTGLRRRNCRARKAGCLDEVFGISRWAESQFAAGNGITVTQDYGKEFSCPGTTIPSALNELNIALSGGKALAVSKGSAGPAVIVNDFGNGKSFYLNFDLSGYIDFRGRGDPIEAGWRKLVKEILEVGAVVPQVVLTTKDGTLPCWEAVVYKDGECDYVGLMLDRNTGKTAFSSIRLPRQAHVYDLRAREYLGRTDTVDVLLEKNLDKTKLYAMLPYEVVAVTVNADAAEFDRGDQVAYTASVVARDAKTIQIHCIHVSVIGPDGKEYPNRLYNRNLLTKAGAASGSFRLALDDAPGRWTIRAQDVVSGKVATATFSVR